MEASTCSNVTDTLAYWLCLFSLDSFQSNFWSAAFGALIGAGSAFVLERTQAWRMERRRNCSLGNQSIYKLSLMYTTLTNLENTLFGDFRAAHDGKDPQWWEVLGHNEVNTSGLRFDISELAFLADTYDPDILNRLMHAERVFATAVDTANRRSALQFELQVTIRQAGLEPDMPMTVEMYRRIGGHDRTRQVEQLHAHLLADLPNERKLMLDTARQLQNVLRYAYPLGRIITYTSELDDIANYKRTSKPAVWRVFVRGARQFLAAPIKTTKSWVLSCRTRKALPQSPAANAREAITG